MATREVRLEAKGVCHVQTGNTHEREQDKERERAIKRDTDIYMCIIYAHQTFDLAFVALLRLG